MCHLYLTEEEYAEMDTWEYETTQGVGACVSCLRVVEKMNRRRCLVCGGLTCKWCDPDEASPCYGCPGCTRMD